jgi:hypothetical protein
MMPSSSKKSIYTECYEELASFVRELTDELVAEAQLVPPFGQEKGPLKGVRENNVPMEQSESTLR